MKMWHHRFFVGKYKGHNILTHDVFLLAPKFFWLGSLFIMRTLHLLRPKTRIKYFHAAPSSVWQQMVAHLNVFPRHSGTCREYAREFCGTVRRHVTFLSLPFEEFSSKYSPHFDLQGWCQLGEFLAAFLSPFHKYWVFRNNAIISTSAKLELQIAQK